MKKYIYCTNERFEDASEIEITSLVTLVEVFRLNVVGNYLLRGGIVGKDRTCGRQVRYGNNHYGYDCNGDDLLQ